MQMCVRNCILLVFLVLDLHDCLLVEHVKRLWSDLHYCVVDSWDHGDK